MAHVVPVPTEVAFQCIFIAILNLDACSMDLIVGKVWSNPSGFLYVRDLER